MFYAHILGLRDEILALKTDKAVIARELKQNEEAAKVTIRKEELISVPRANLEASYSKIAVRLARSPSLPTSLLQLPLAQLKRASAVAYFELGRCNLRQGHEEHFGLERSILDAAARTLTRPPFLPSCFLFFGTLLCFALCRVCLLPLKCRSATT